MIKTIILCYKTVTWPLLQYCKNILCLLALIFHELGLGNKGNWESTKIKSKLTWNQLWPVTYYNQHYIVTTFFRSPSSISNVGQSFILAHTGRYNNNSDLFVLAISLTMHVYPKLKTSEAGQGGYFPSYRARSICIWHDLSQLLSLAGILTLNDSILHALLKTIILGCQSSKLHLLEIEIKNYYHL